MESATPLAHAVLLGWIPLAVLLFFILPKRRAIIASFVIGWLFLPVMGYPIKGLPDLDKMMAVNLGALLGLVLADRGRSLMAYRPHWIDLPVIVWCLCPIASSLSNGLGLYDGLSVAFEQTVAWGVPYLIARTNFTTIADLRELAVGIVLAGLVYVPLCLYEVRMSPQLHNIFYGFYQHSFVQTKRMGGFRPMVFMNHGLMAAMLMSMSAMLAGWLWYSGTLRRLWGVPMSVIAGVLLVTAVLCKSATAMGALAIGVLALLATRHLRTALPLIVLVLMPPMYLIGRGTEALPKPVLLSTAEMIAGEPRAQSLEYRLDEEEPLFARAMERPIFGWGGWNRSRRIDADKDEKGRRMQVTDSLWIAALGQNGFVGLISVVTTLLLPPLLVFSLLPQSRRVRPPGAVMTGLALICVLFMFDCLLNAMINPIYLLGLGGCSALLAQRLRQGRPQPVPRRVQGSRMRSQGHVSSAPGVG
jgi:O-antigen ligase